MKKWTYCHYTDIHWCNILGIDMVKCKQRKKVHTSFLTLSIRPASSGGQTLGKSFLIRESTTPLGVHFPFNPAFFSPEANYPPFFSPEANSSSSSTSLCSYSSISHISFYHIWTYTSEIFLQYTSRFLHFTSGFDMKKWDLCLAYQRKILIIPWETTSSTGIVPTIASWRVIMKNNRTSRVRFCPMVGDNIRHSSLHLHMNSFQWPEFQEGHINRRSQKPQSHLIGAQLWPLN